MFSFPYKLNQSQFLFYNKSFRSFWLARVSSTLAYQMLTVAVGWQIYAVTNSTFYLGLIGLVQFLPMLLLTLIAGHVADRFDRRKITGVCQIVEGAGIFILALGSFNNWLGYEDILVIVFIVGVARAFEVPAMQALLPSLVSVEEFPKAIATVSSSTQTATIIGPAFGGLLYAWMPTSVYLVVSMLFVLAGLFVSSIRHKLVSPKRQPVNIASLFAGIKFIYFKRVILGAISLDLFAVLLGGATALLPVYASEILDIGPTGLGILRSAPAVGALGMALFLTRHPLKKSAGKLMFAAVLVFGMATIAFGFSTSFFISLSALIIIGAADVISVVIRSSLVQLNTPDDMRGRVSAVNSLFIGTSNQLGEFESGLMATYFGVVPAVVLGGAGTIAVALVWMRIFSELTKIERIDS